MFLKLIGKNIMDIKIYHNTRCKKSRAGLAHLNTFTKDFEIIEYLKSGISINELRTILNLSGLNIMALIRKQEDIYKKEFKGKDLSEDDWIKIICENPKLLQRPFVLKEGKAVLGDPPENINQLFG